MPKSSSPSFLGLLDLDSTLLDTYGEQEGESFNYHYQSHGYHPLACCDGMTGDLLKIQLRDGNVYSSNGVVEFLQPLLDEFAVNCPDIPLFLRGDSGFAAPELYRQCEENGISYAIRLKGNRILRELAADADAMLTEKTRSNMVDYAVEYGESLYQAGSWDYPRRVVSKIEKPYGQMIHMDTFIVTNMDSAPEKLIKIYCKRGKMENYIKESKNGFDFTAISSHAETNGSLRFIVGEGNRPIRGKAQNIPLVVSQPLQQAENLSLSGASTLPFRLWGWDIIRNPKLDNGIIAHMIRLQNRSLKAGFAA